MCFSPEISFAASAVVAAIGLITLKKVKMRREILLASIPLFFAGQQLIEGFIWLNLLHNGPIETKFWLTQLYAGFAGILWPLMVPFAIILIEKDQTRKNYMILSVIAGLTITFATLFVINHGGFNAQIVNHCILYNYTETEIPYAIRWIYVVATCVPFLLSSEKVIRWFGMLNVVTFLAAYHVYYTVYASVWCFFAAITSGFIYLYFLKTAEKHEKEQSLAKISNPAIR